MSRLPHLFVQGSAETERYIYTGEVRTGLFKTPPRDGREEHGNSLRRQVKEIEDEEAPVTESPITPSGPEGTAIEFESAPNFKLKLESLERRNSGIKLLNARTEGDVMYATVFVPKDKLGLFDRAFERYIHEDAKGGNPKGQSLIESITEIRRALLPSFWTDTNATFPNDNETVWWEVWLRDEGEGIDVEQSFRDGAVSMQIEVAPTHIVFPERIVILAKANPTQWTRMNGLFTLLAELRRAKIVPTDFLNLPPHEQTERIERALERITFAGANAPAVCLLDTGVNRGHPLLQLALAEEHLLTCNTEWSAADHCGHGTEMAGISLFSCLTTLLANNDPVVLSHRLESVKILPPTGANRPEQFGAITDEGVARAELTSPNRNRAICLAVTADSRDEGMPSSWSAALDQTCSGVRDEIRRLMFVSAGNTDPTTRDQYPDRNHVQGVQDPSQAWNVVTVGAFTERTVIQSREYENWRPVAPPGALCPASTTSLVWENKTWPLKPDIVMEGGNNAINPETGDAEFIDDLSLLTTHLSPTGALLTVTGETSAATAQAARLGAMIQAEYPTYWPETIRGLVIHSAEWTKAMTDEFPSDSQRLKQDRLRCYGYGVPNLERARWCASNHATLVAQETLQPFDQFVVKERKEIKSKDMHVHALPWPIDVLQGLGEEIVTMRVTLSYFIEPSPGRRWTQKHRYQSCGLRFDVKRPTETISAFKQRLSRAHWDDPEERPESASEDREWEIGSRLRTKGSVHSDIWHGTASELAACGHIGVYPVTGWWKERKHLEGWRKRVRYALIISITSPKIEIDLYTPIATKIGIET